MRMNHLDLQVSDVQAAGAFFETHFGLRCTYTRGSEIAIFGDDAGFAFGVSNLFGHTDLPVYPPDFYIGFILEDAEAVKAAHSRLGLAGVALATDLREAGPNLYFRCAGPDGIPIEVQAPRQR